MDLPKVIKAGNKNLATTLLGLAAGAAMFLSDATKSDGFDWSDWQNWLGPVAVAALGFVAKNSHNSGKDGGTS